MMSLSDVAAGSLLLVLSAAVAFAIVCGLLWYLEHRRQKRWAAADARMHAEAAAFRAAMPPLYRELRWCRRLNARTGTITWCYPQERAARPVERFERGFRDIVVEALALVPIGALFVLNAAFLLLTWLRPDMLEVAFIALMLLFGIGAVWTLWALWRAWPWRPGDVAYFIFAMTTLLGFGDILSHLPFSSSGPILPSLQAAVVVGIIGLAGCVVVFLIDFRHREPR
jgi:hypothetical protein